MLTDILSREVPSGEILNEYTSEIYYKFINYSMVLDNETLVLATYDVIQNAVNVDLVGKGLYQLIGDYEDALKIARGQYLMDISDGSERNPINSLEG